MFKIKRHFATSISIHPNWFTAAEVRQEE